VSAASSRVIRLPWCGCPDAPQGAGSGQGDAFHWAFALATETAVSLVAGFRRQVERFAVPTNALPLAHAPAGHQRFGVGGVRQGHRLSRSIIKFRPLRLRHLGPDKSPLAVEGNGSGFHRAGVPCSAEQQDRKQPPSAVHFELVCRSRFQRSNAPASVRLQAIKTALAGIHRQGDGKHRSCGLDRIGHRRPHCRRHQSG